MKTVILCGGSGTRLWPISRKTRPKQFAKIFGGKSLYEMTLERNREFSDNFIVVANQSQLELCQDQTSGKDNLFLAESAARNTAPAIAMAALASEPEDILLVLPSDHLIKDRGLYLEAVRQAAQLAGQGSLVTFGVKAAYPETGYGYIEADGNEVKSFKEKPELELAKKYVADGRHYWNSGMFCFKAGVFLAELDKHSPDISAACKEAFSRLPNIRAQKSGDTIELAAGLMERIPAQSVDYAVMEKSDNVKVVPSRFYWSDLGSFDSLYSELKKDPEGNTVFRDHISLNSKNNLVMGEKRVIATFDVEDLIIADTEDALLIGKRGQGQKVKELLKKVAAKRPDLTE